MFFAVDREWSPPLSASLRSNASPAPRARPDSGIGGLSSGEGLIDEVREGRGKDDPGVTDKRLLVVEPESASVLKVASRERNTFSAILRQAWEDGSLRTMVVTNPARATGTPISILGHITREELFKNGRV